jgi:hypothetical protein
MLKPIDTHLKMHKEMLIGVVNLPKDQVKSLCQMFKCVQCPMLFQWSHSPVLPFDEELDHQKEVEGR